MGRLASEISLLLRGKNNPWFNPARPAENRVTVFYTDKIRVTGKKLIQKRYRRHSGYHGGLKEERLKEALARDSRRVVRHAVMGMLPKNKTRKRTIARLTLIKGEK